MKKGKRSEDEFRAAALKDWRLFKPSEKSFRKPAERDKR